MRADPFLPFLVSLMFALLGATGCDQKMATESKLEPLRESSFFANRQADRLPVPGTVARGRLTEEIERREGTFKSRENARIPLKVTAELLRRGRERFEIYCAPCHSETGDGRGMVVRRGFLPPPSYHIERLRKAADGHFYDVITYGKGAMFSYAERVPDPRDRWAIVAYIRALQLSQNYPMMRLEPGERAKLEEGPRSVPEPPKDILKAPSITGPRPESPATQAPFHAPGQEGGAP